MRILWLNSGLLVPLDKGGKLRTWHLMRHLARRHTITWLSFAPPDTDDATRDQMREVCGELHLVPRRDTAKGTVAFYAAAAARLFDPLPYAVGAYRSREYRDRLAGLLATQRFDLIVCDFLPPLVNMPERLPCPTVLFTHNVEAEIWRRHASQQPDRIRRVLFEQQWSRMRRFESAALRRFSRVLAVSDTDAATFRRLYPAAVRTPIDTVATGVDTDYFRPSATAPDPAHLVFTGSMDWLPNEDAMRYCCEQLLPRIRAELPGATLSIVGRGPTPAVRRLAEQPGVDVTGRVEDVRPHIARAAVYIVPLRIGGGTRLKIFEAMAMGKAVVSTTIGAEGLPVRDGADIRLADEPDAFARAVVSLVRNPASRVHLERAARALVVERHDWSAVATQLEASLEHARQSAARAA